MLADTESVQGFIGCADTWCEEHKPDNCETESLGYYPESDSPLHCAECGRPLQCSLTDYGAAYVTEAIENSKDIEGGGGCCRELWPILFADYLT